MHYFYTIVYTLCCCATAGNCSGTVSTFFLGIYLSFSLQESTTVKGCPRQYGIKCYYHQTQLYTHWNATLHSKAVWFAKYAHDRKSKINNCTCLLDTGGYQGLFQLKHPLAHHLSFSFQNSLQMCYPLHLLRLCLKIFSWDLLFFLFTRASCSEGWSQIKHDYSITTKHGSIKIRVLNPQCS